jgi:hypothetical protein
VATTMPGLDAIVDGWARIHPDVEPIQVRLGAGTALGGPFDGVFGYPLPGHWLLVSYGLTELGPKESDIAELSGSGFEFTCRLARDPGATIPPEWMIRVMSDLATRFLAGADLDVGDWIVTPSPLGGATEAGPLTSLAIVIDTELASIDTPNGAVNFFQLVGLTAAEGAAANEAGTVEPIVAELRQRDPLLVTDPARPSLR